MPAVMVMAERGLADTLIHIIIWRHLVMEDNRSVTRWTGWVTFAALFLMFEGVINFFYGLGALFNAQWFVYGSGTAYLVDISSWGWWMLIMSAVLVLSGILLMAGSAFGRAMGALFATLSLLVNISIFTVAPIWSTIAIILDVMVIYAILAHGGEMKTLSAPAPTFGERADSDGHEL
jgi:hypothetical protein